MFFDVLATRLSKHHIYDVGTSAKYFEKSSRHEHPPVVRFHSPRVSQHWIRLGSVYTHNVVVIVAIYGAAQIHTCLLSVLSKTDYDTLLPLDLTLDNLKFIVSSSSAFSKVKS
jgi:hypothetical protein